MCLHREDAEHGFDDREVDVIRRIAPHVAEGLRRAVTLGPARPARDSAGAGAPGLILLDPGLALMSMSPGGERVAGRDRRGRLASCSELPMAVYAAAMRGWPGWSRGPLAAAGGHVRLRSRDRAVALPARVPAGRPADAADRHRHRAHRPRRSSARCCSARTGSPARSPGWSRWSSGGTPTRQIVEELPHISANTVQEHLTAAFDKFGVRSRRELWPPCSPDIVDRIARPTDWMTIGNGLALARTILPGSS